MNPLRDRYLQAKAQAAGQAINSVAQRVGSLPQQFQALGQLFNQGFQDKTPIKQRIANNRPYIEQQVAAPATRAVNNFIDRVPNIFLGPTAPLARPAMKFVAESGIDQLTGASALRGMEALTSRDRQKELYNQGPLGVAGGVSDVAGLIPFVPARLKVTPGLTKGVAKLTNGKAAKLISKIPERIDPLLKETVGIKLKREVPLAKQLTKSILETPQQVQLGLQLSQQGQQSIRSMPAGGSFGSSEKIISQVPNPTDPYFNVNKLKIGKKGKAQVAKVVEEVKPQIEQLVGTKLSNKEAVNLANNSASLLHKTVTRQETLAWEAKMLKARQLLADQAQNGAVTQEYIDNLLAIKSQGTDIARKLQSLGVGADPQTITAKQAILESVLKLNLNTDEILRAAKGVDFNDLRQATEFYRKFIAPTKEDWLDLVRYNSMLSSPNTHIINTSSNFQGTGIVAPIEKTLLGGVDFLKSTVTGAPRQYKTGEGLAYAKGYYSNLRNASHRFSEVMTGKRMNMNPDLRKIPLTTGGTKRQVENVLSFPLRLLEGMDQFFTTLTEAGVNRSLGYRQSKGIKVLTPGIKAQQEAAQRLFRGELSPEGQGYVLGVLDAGANAIMAFRNHDNPVVRTIAKYTLPFVMTPTNIAKQAAEYTPLGFSTMVGASNKAEQFTKALMGTSIALGAATLLASDRLSWAEPTDAKKRNAYRAAGLQPYSVKIGNKWVSYSKLHPAVAFNLAIVAALRDANDNQRLGDGEVETVLTGLTKFVNFFADQSYVRNIGDFVASTKGDVEGPTRYLSNYAQQNIPFRALMGWVARLTDPYQRQVDHDGAILEKQLQQLATQIPLLSQTVPARADVFGQPIENQNRGLNAFSPARVTTEEPNNKAIYDGMVEKSRETKMVNDVKKQLMGGAELDSSGFPQGSIVSGDGLASPDDQQTPQGNTSFNIGGVETPGVVVGKKFVYMDEESGEVKSTTVSALKQKELSYDKELTDARYGLLSEQLKRANDPKSWVETTEGYISYLEKYKEKITDEAAQIRVQNKIEDLKVSVGKYKGQGGFKKAKKPKKLKITRGKVPSFKIKRAKAIKVKKLRLKQIKLDEPKGAENAKKITLKF